MKILLINPKGYDKLKKSSEKIRLSPLNLGIIAALSENDDVTIIDEDFEKINYNIYYDLVGISVITFAAINAFKISKKFRKKNIKVIFGGIYPSLSPKSCLNHADSIVIGEVEYLWREIIKDLKNNKLKKIYDGSNKIVELKDVPYPKRQLFNKKFYNFETIQATRGCNNRCKFCYISDVKWNKYRKRDILDIINELKSIKSKYITFIDDNLFLDKEYAKKLFKAMIPLKKYWSAQAPTNIYNDKELIKLMSESGCISLGIGFQSFNNDSLKSCNVFHNNIKKYKILIKILHRYNILVQSFFIFGFDNDKKDIFKKTVNIIKYLDIDDVYFHILTPFPNTKLYEELEKENRILTKDLTKYDLYKCVFRPKYMTQKELEKGLKNARKDIEKYFNKKIKKKRIKFWKYYINFDNLKNRLSKRLIDLNP